MSPTPTEFRLFRWGQNDTSKGVFHLTPASAKKVMAAYEEQGVDLALDYEHQAVQDVPMVAPAAGWFNLALREDGLWAVNVRWTPAAERHLTGKEYRYFSPAFLADDDDNIVRIINCALTNQPATRRQDALVAASRRSPQERIMMLTQRTRTLAAVLPTALISKVRSNILLGLSAAVDVMNELNADPARKATAKEIVDHLMAAQKALGRLR